MPHINAEGTVTDATLPTPEESAQPVDEPAEQEETKTVSDKPDEPNETRAQKRTTRK